MAIALALLLVVVMVACLFLTLLGMPGNWLMVAITAVFAYFVPAQSAAALGWKTVVVLLVLAALGEVVELLAGAMGTARAGGSRRGAVMALVGSLVGGVVGMVVGLPIPVVGSVLAAVLFAAVGAMAGAILGEMHAGRDLTGSWQVGKLAFLGRLAGTAGKLLVGATMVAVVVVALIL